MNRESIRWVGCLLVVSFAGLAGEMLAVAADPPMLGTLNASDYLVSIDRGTGVATQIGHLGIGFLEAMTSLEYDGRHDVLYGAVVNRLYTVSPTTGLATRVHASNQLQFNAKGFAYNPIADVMYGAGVHLTTIERNNLYLVDRVSGTSSLVGLISGLSYGLQGLTFDPGTNTLYGLDEMLPSGARIVKIDPVAKTATPVSPIINAARTGWNGLTFDPLTGAIFVSDDRQLYRFNPANGVVTNVGAAGTPGVDTFGALTVMQPYLVPEPASVFLYGLLVAHGVAFTNRRRRR